MKLKYKLSILIFILILLTAGVNYFLVTRTFESLQIKRLESAEVLLGQTLARKMYRMVVEAEVEGVVALLFKEKILREEKLNYLVVFDRSGKLFGHTYLAEIPAEVVSLDNSFENGTGFRIDNFLTTDLGVYNVAVPIKEGIIQVGTLHIGIDKEFIAETASPLRKASTLTLMWALLLVIIGGGLAFAAGIAITRSLSRLEAVAVRLSRGEFNVEIDDKSSDEVGRLAKAFSAMRNSIQEAQLKLEKHNENLEATVKERTAQLESNNRKLERSYEQMQLLNQDLEEQKRNLKIVFSAMTYPLYVVNLDYSIAMMNDVAEAMAKEFPAAKKKCYEIALRTTTPCESADQTCVLQQVLSTKKSAVFEHQRFDSQGKMSQVEVHGYPIFDSSGEVMQIVESVIDVTEKRRAEKEKLRLERELNKAQRLEAIGTLAAGVAHEINTPIQFIGDNTRFVAESVDELMAAIARYEALVKDDQEVANEALDEIRDEFDLDYLQEELPTALAQTLDGTVHVADIVKAMKDFSHVGSEEEMQPHDLNHAIETTVIISKNEWRYVANLDLKLTSDLPEVPCYIGEIKQVILNLIINGAHAIREKQNNTDGSQKGSIIISTKAEEEVVEISVEDSGSGIQEEHREKIFDHFYTTKEVGKGSGQGLSVAYQIIHEKHQGKIWFETEVGKGSTFFIQLPRSERPSAN